MQPTEFSIDATIAKCDNHVSCEIDGKAVLMSVENRKYNQLTGVRARVWSALYKPQSMQSLRTDLCRKYRAEASRCEQETLHFLQELKQRNLIQPGRTARN